MTVSESGVDEISYKNQMDRADLCDG